MWENHNVGNHGERGSLLSSCGLFEREREKWLMMLWWKVWERREKIYN